MTATIAKNPIPLPLTGKVSANFLSARRVACALIVGFTVVNLLYLFLACPVDLSPDEAHYWDWSRRLDWCYYSKGPLIALLIRGGCELLGDFAVQTTGTLMPAVRAPAVLCNVLLLTAIFKLARQTFVSNRFALVVTALVLTVPPLTAGSVMITIDAPYLCCWAWACVFVQRGVTGGWWWVWAAAGAVCAAGLLAKQTMVLFPACVAAHLFWAGGWTPPAKRGFALMCAIATVGLIPIGIWNAGHDWVSIRHIFTMAAGPGRDGEPVAEFAGFLGLLDYVGGQFGLLFGYWFVAWVGAAVWFAPRRGREGDIGVAFLWWTSVPVWALFAVASVKAKGQPNWPAAAYVTGCVLAVAWVSRQIVDPRPWYRRTASGFLALGIVGGLAGGVVVRFPWMIRPVLASLVSEPTPTNPTPVRKLDPTCRLQGWRTLARAVDEARERVRAVEGYDPPVAAMTWFVPGELAFYCRNHPETFTFGAALDDRHSQYDFWHPNPLADAQAFRGRTFVYVGDLSPELERAFDRVDPPVEVIASDGGIPVADWSVRVLYGFKGFPANPGERRDAGY
ncbi:ArnT family glycosyltransferase [Fimbriiglobus ruber]|uniref:Glycosyltransferase RgtA/B/C/D-like domain-containing protein n=1 Tax=Fimbriiglobus ruber TaxID=1908690 RepID=A0A225E2C5_9BACT|nr:glycosyltransferase family 39 protein [Fimbriiglobus ruber]OWK47393.1 hypothetical protein FRUB_01092 [Fimbriiglobus ruber]